METAGQTPFAATAPQRADANATSRAVSSRVMNCLAVSYSAERRQAWRHAATEQTWDALICRDATEFRECARKRRLALIVVDLPSDAGSIAYCELLAATLDVKTWSTALIAVCGSSSSSKEELWARSLGSWLYLNGVDEHTGMELVLREARLAAEQWGP